MPPPLLLINGYAATGADWDPTFLAELERRTACCARTTAASAPRRSATGS